MTQKKFLMAGTFATALLAASLNVACAVDAPPPLTMQQEAARHPRIVEAIRNLQQARRELEAAPESFGGHKAQAIQDINVAIRSLKRALFYRLRVDDNALDRYTF